MHLKIKFKAKEKEKEKLHITYTNIRQYIAFIYNKRIMITIKDETEEFAWDPNQIKTKYQGQLIKIKGKVIRKRVFFFCISIYKMTIWNIHKF